MTIIQADSVTGSVAEAEDWANTSHLITIAE